MVKQIIEELTIVWVTLSDVVIECSSLKGFPKEWDPFASGIVAKEKLPGWDKLWDDCFQQEIKRGKDVEK